MLEPDAMRVLGWLCSDEARVRGMLRDSDVMQALGLSEADAQAALGRLKAGGMIQSRRTFTQGLEAHRHSVWGIHPTEKGRTVLREGGLGEGATLPQALPLGPEG